MTSSATPPTVATPPPTTPRTWMPVTAGILSIISGAGAALAGFAALVFVNLIASFAGMPKLGSMGILWPIIGIVAIIGGVFALQRKAWLVALVGAVCALIWPLTLLGILAVIFVSLAKKEFE